MSSSSSGKKSVDEIWKELNARNQPKPNAARRDTNLSGIANLPGVTTITRVLPKTQLPASLAAAAAAPAPNPGSAPTLEDVPINGSLAGEGQRPRAPAYDPSQAGVAPGELQDYVARIQRTINCLSDPDRSTRRQAVTSLQTKLFQGDSVTPKPSPQMLQALLCGPLAYPLLQLLHDQVEKCRGTSLAILADGLQALPDPSPLLPALLPEVLRRMGQLPVQEGAEEIRLQLAGLVAVIIARSDKRQLQAAAPDLCIFLCRAQEDGFHDIKKAGCAALAALVGALPHGALEGGSEKLLQSLLPNLQHQHSRVRLAAIQALDALVAGGVAAGLVESLVAPGVRPVTYDRAPAVREAIFQALAHWLGAAPSAAGGAGAVPGMTEAAAAAARVHAPALLPLLMVGVTDPVGAVAAQALELLEAVGDAWEAAGGSSSAMDVDQPTCSSSSKQPESSGDVSMADASQQPQASTSEGDSGDGENRPGWEAAVAACQLQAPYKGRPRRGARRMVLALLGDLLPPALKELAEWTVVQRLCAARSLHTTLVMAEDAATPHLPSLVPALCSAIGDESAEVAGYVIAGVHAVGAHVPVKRWLPLALDHLGSSRLGVGQRANSLVVLAGLMHAAARAGQAPDQELLGALATTLASEEIRERGVEHPAVRQQLLAVLTNALAWGGAMCAAPEVCAALFAVLMQLRGFEAKAGAAGGPAGGAQEGQEKAAVAAPSSDPAATTSTAAAAAAASASPLQSALARLACLSGQASVEGLADAQADGLLGALAADCDRWEPESPTYLGFKALLRTAGPATLSRLLPRLAGEVLGPLLADHERDPALRLSVLQLLDGLLEDEARGPALGGAAAERVLRELLLPPLVWRAGKTAAAVRFTAITALATMLARGRAPAEALGKLVADGSLLPLLHQCLEEDWYVDVRLSAAAVLQRLLQAVGPGLSHEARRAVYPELLKRLDDSNNGVRIAACRALQAFCATMGPGYCDTNSGYLAQGVVIHMDDSDPAVQEAACGVLEAMAAFKPHVVAEEVGKVRERFRAKHYCDRLLALCGAAPEGGQ